MHGGTDLGWLRQCVRYLTTSVSMPMPWAEMAEYAKCTALVWGHVNCVQLLLGRNVPLEHLNNAAKMAWDEGSGEILHMLAAKGTTALTFLPPYRPY